MKRYLSLVLSVLLLHVFSLAALATDSPLEKSKKALLTSQVKAGIASLGTGKSSRVRVLLNDKTKYHGYITEIGNDYFVVADAKTGVTAPLPYPEVKGINGNNFSTGAKIGIGVAIAVAIAIAIAVAASGDDDERPPGNVQCIRAPCP